MKLLHVPGVLGPGVLGLVVAVGLASGCDRSPRVPRAQRSTTATLDELPELADPIGPLDGQRIEVAPPKGWHVPSQSHRWIVRFTASEQLQYPTILVTAGDYEGLSDVSKANVEEFARQIAGAFEREKSSAKQAMTVTPIEIGRFVGVSYRRRGKAPYGMKEIVVERLLLDTVVAGRKYTIELRTRDGDLDRFQPYLFAVAAGIKFLQPESGGESQQPDAGSNSEPSEEDAA
ncbi:MAG: hypothetical protein ACYSWU_02860 [Planctomycetota bacterium]